MLAEICAYCRNYFVVPNGIHKGTFTVSGGKLTPLDFLRDNQYFRIVGSLFNDGVYQYPADKLTDESFAGEIWAMAVPPAVVALSKEVENYCNSGGGKPSPYVSENYPNGYSYSKATNSNGLPVSWKQVFADQLTEYRRPCL